MFDNRIYADRNVLVNAVAGLFVEQAAEAIAQRGRFAVVLSGGGTPGPIFSRLTDPAFSERIDWRKVHVFWSDERCVSPDSRESNYWRAKDALLDFVPVPCQHIHRMEGEFDATEAADRYENELRAFFADQEPAFDLVFLGMGADGHCASLFPNTDAVRERTRWVVGCHVESLGAWRVTLTPVILNKARCVVFIVLGEQKAQTVHDVRNGPFDPERLPSQAIRPESGRLVWVLDTAAAGLL